MKNKINETKNEAVNCRILAKDVFMNNDTWKTGINNNDLIIGPSGAGKTRGYVRPNILQAQESMLIADTKGNLCKEMRPYLTEKGFKVQEIDFMDIASSATGYNPLDYIRTDAHGDFHEQDLTALCKGIIPGSMHNQDPYWENAARMYLECLCAYVLECLPKAEHNLSVVAELLQFMGSSTLECDMMFDELIEAHPNSISARKYQLIAGARRADKTDASIRAVLMERMNLFLMNSFRDFFAKKDKVQFSTLGMKKTALFLRVSDNDRSMDQLVNLFYTQALQGLIHSADRDYMDCRLPVPVRFILDDFATNTVIPDFDNISSVARSREIYLSLIIQSLSQLDGLYGEKKATTIINNCDNCLYLGGQDVETARFMSVKLNKPVSDVLCMGLDQALLFTRGSKPSYVEKYDLTKHPDYKKMQNAYETQLKLIADGFTPYDLELPFE